MLGNESFIVLNKNDTLKRMRKPKKQNDSSEGSTDTKRLKEML